MATKFAALTCSGIKNHMQHNAESDGSSSRLRPSIAATVPWMCCDMDTIGKAEGSTARCPQSENNAMTKRDNG